METVAQKVLGEILVGIYSSCIVKGNYTDINRDLVQKVGTEAYGECFSDSLPASLQNGTPVCRNRDPVGALFATLGTAGLLRRNAYGILTAKYPTLLHESIPEAAKRAGDYLAHPMPKQTAIHASLEEMADVLRSEGIQGADSAAVIHSFAAHLKQGKHTDLLHDPIVSKCLQAPIGTK